MNPSQLWNRLPAIIRAPVMALLITLFGSVVWNALLIINLQTTPQVLWAFPAMAVVLWLLWQYLGGKGWPASTSALRRGYLRANAVSRQGWLWALVAGLSGVVSLSGMWIVLGGFIAMPPNLLQDLSAYPAYVPPAIILMISIVAPITEESGFRGYGQIPLEKRYGVRGAIVISAVFFSAAHLSHGFFPAALLVYFLAGVMFSVSAVLVNSILPGIFVHVAVDLTFFNFVWPGDAGRVLVSQGGADGWFWLHVAQVLAFGALSVWGYRKLGELKKWQSAVSREQ